MPDQVDVAPDVRDPAADVERQLDALDAWARAAILDLLLTEGAIRPGEPFTTDDVVHGLRCAPRHRRVVARWLLVLADHGVLARDPESGRHCLPAGAQPPGVDVAAAAVRTGTVAGPALWGFYRRCAELLGPLVRDEVSVQAVFFDSPGALEEIYSANAASEVSNALAADAVVAAQPRHVLEIGAGVGGTTDSVVPRLDADVRYDFTDVSDYFLTDARQRYARVDLRTRLLDINDEPRMAEEDRPDVVLAANVLHNAPDATRVARWLRTVPKPGGRVVMIETGREHHPLLLSMRLLMSPPADRPDDAPVDERRHTHRILLDRAEWAGAFEHAGFEEVRTAPGDDDPAAALCQFVLTARVPEGGRRG